MIQPSLFDLPPRPPALVYNGLPPSRPVETSRAAAAKQAHKAPSIRMQVLAFVRERGERGATAEEAGDALAELRGLPPGTTCARLSAAARLTELKLAGFVIDSGRRRETRGGCRAVVLVATDKKGDGHVCERQE